GPLGVRRAPQALHPAPDAHLAPVAAEGVDAREDLEDRRLPRAVLAAEAEDLTGLRREVRALQRAHASEALLDADHLEGEGAGGSRRRRAHPRERLRRRSARSEGMPPRRTRKAGWRRSVPPARQRQAPVP